MTCDLDAIRAAHAHAIEWHTFKGETKEVIDAVPSLLDALAAGLAREAALTAEVERLRSATPGYTLGGDYDHAHMRDVLRATIVERDTARADAANARRVATEAIDALDEAARYIAGDGELMTDVDQADRVATLRARLASPEAKGLRCIVDDLVDSSGPLVGIEYCEDPESERADREQRHATARALLLAALGAKET